MKKLINLIILAVLAALTCKYLVERDVNVTDILSGTVEKVTSIANDLRAAENLNLWMQSNDSDLSTGVTEHPSTTSPDIPASTSPPLQNTPDHKAADNYDNGNAGRKNGSAIPEAYDNVIEYIIEPKPGSKSDRFPVLDEYATTTPRHAEASIESLVDWLIKPASTDLEKTRLIFTWIATHVSYDDAGYNTGRYSDTSPEGVFRNRVSVCQGYSELFTRMCSIAGLEAYTVKGYAKGISYREGQPISGTNHAWNIVMADGRLRLFDATWAAGYGTAVRGRLVSVKRFDDFWFDVSPADFIFTHFPADERLQLLPVPITRQQFQRMPYASGLFFKIGFNGNQCLNEYLGGTLTSLPESYNTSYDVRVVSMPWSGRLKAGQVIRFKVLAGEGVTPAYESGGQIIRMKPDGDIYSATIRLEPGEFSLLATSGVFFFETVLKYMVE